MGLGAKGHLVDGGVHGDHLIQHGSDPRISRDLVDVGEAVYGHEGTAHVGGELPALQQGGGVAADTTLVEVLGVAVNGVAPIATRRWEVEVLGDRLEGGQGELVSELLVVLAEAAQVPGVTRELLLVDHGILLGIEVQVLVGVLGESRQQLLHAGVDLPRHFVVADEGQQGAALLVARPIGAVFLKYTGHLVVGIEKAVVGAVDALGQLGFVKAVGNDHVRLSSRMKVGWET